MKDDFSIVKGIRFPRYSLKIVKFSDGEFGVIESFYFFKFCYRRNVLRFTSESERRSSTKICTLPESLII